jgi:hypothetical protein
VKRTKFIGASATLAAALPAIVDAASRPTIRTVSRAQLAYDRRVAAASAERDTWQPSLSNGDEQRYVDRDYAGSFTKGLPHDKSGRVNNEAFRAMRSAIDARDVKLLDPHTSPILKGLIEDTLTDDTCLGGCDPFGIPLVPPARLDESQTANDAIELAWLALTRDIPFAAYETDPLIAAAAADLHATPQTVFRPSGPAAIGPLLSQLVLADIPRPPYGSFQQRYDLFVAHRDYLVTQSDWLAAQNGVRVPNGPAFESTKRYVTTGRDLAAWVTSPNSPFGEVIAIIDALPPEAHTDLWDTDSVLGMLGLANDVAGIGTFYQKFVVHLRLRPEALFGLLNEDKRGVRLDPSLRASPALEHLRKANGTVLLPQAYPNGSPTHPSYPAAHATHAGAAATIVKAYVREDFAWQKPMVATSDGSALTAYTGGSTLTLGGEIDKFAVNYAYGRQAAGVHFRQDSDAGLRYGEAAALSVLRDTVAVSGKKFPGFSLTTFDGKRVKIGGKA